MPLSASVKSRLYFFLIIGSSAGLVALQLDHGLDGKESPYFVVSGALVPIFIGLCLFVGGVLLRDGQREIASVRRAISPVIGVVLMVVLVVMLASVVAGLVFAFSDTPNTDTVFESGEEDGESGVVSPWDSDPLLAPEDPTAGATDVRYRMYFEIKDGDAEGNSLNDVTIEVNTSDEMFSGTGQNDIEIFEVNKTDGTTFDISGDVDGWSTENDGSKLVIGLGGSAYTNPKIGDAIIIIFDGVDNPADPGTYDLDVQINGGDDQQEGELEIVEP
jgi:flagellin-like protein